MYDSRTQRFYLAANLAVRIYRGLYLGGGLAFMSRSSGTVELRGDIALADPNASVLQSSVAVIVWRFAIRSLGCCGKPPRS